MAATLNVGQKLPLSIAYLDQNGQPMSPTPTPDSAPQWSQTSPSTESLTQSVDGNTASTTGLVAGSDTVNLWLTVNGQTFTASLGVTVSGAGGGAGQTLTSVEIVPGTAA